MANVLRVFLIAGAATSVLATAALAGGPLEEPAFEPAPEPIQATDYDWSGVYIGANAGFGFSGEFDNTAGLNLDDAFGFVGGGVVGYNYQIERFVFGVEGDLNYTSLDASDLGVEAELDFLGTITARAGFTPVDRILTHLEGGYAFGRASVDTGVVSDDNFHNGFTVGAGAEYAISDKLISGIEYNYVDLQDQTFDLGAAAPEADFDGHIVKFNLKYKF
ncbi:MAG: outer membrane protein [Pseudomonadota bacterium]